MLASKKPKSICLVCNGTGLLNKSKKSKSRSNPAAFCPNCVGSGTALNNPEKSENKGLSKNAILGLSVLGVLSLGGLAILLTGKKDTEKVTEGSTGDEKPTQAGDAIKPTKAGDVVTSSQGVGMIFCPKGEFTMGHLDEFDNQPRLEKIERPFLLGKNLVTQKLYQKVVNSNPSSFLDNNQNPVDNISWEDAVTFCNKLSELEGLQLCYTKNSGAAFDWSCDFGKNGYRLPTEKEWEYAAKAGTQNIWSGTNDEKKLVEYAWYVENAGSKTHPVGTRKPNGWELYDMSGNLWEWCWDKYDAEDKDLSASRTVRGGAWNADAESLTTACRFKGAPGDILANRGLRVCRTFIG